MKTLKLFSLLLLLVISSCSDSNDSETEKQQNENNGNISVAFLNGAVYSFDIVTATYNDYYELSTQQELKITAKSSDPAVTGVLTIELYDNDTSNKSFINDASITFRNNSSNAYAKINLVDNDLTFSGKTGTLKINSIKFNAVTNPEYISLSGIIDTSDGKGQILLGNINDIKMYCANGAECGG